jgi:hypothetical protein
MKDIRFLFLLLLINATAYGQFKMPSFKEVVSTFFSKYSFDSYDSYLKFQRKKDGWHLAQDSFTNPGSYFNDQLFWSKDAGKFIVLDYPAATGDSSFISEMIARYLVQINWDYEEYQFQRNRYYGYPGWDWDVINDTAGRARLSDTLLEGRARAFSNYASGFVAEQFGDLFVNNDPDRQPLRADAAISSSRVEKFLFYELQAIRAYSELLKLNPGYVTKVGSVKIKLANEYMFTYLELLMARDTARALSFAQRAAYPDSLLSLSQNYLSALPPNSILITSGDNDTYPLWYLQKVRKFRPDVTVLNSSLIGFRKYLHFISRQEGQRLFSTGDSTFLQSNSDFFLFGNTDNDSMEIAVGTFLRQLASGYNPYDTSIYAFRGETVRKYYAKNLHFKGNDGQRGRSFSIGDAIFLNDYMLLDIINTVGRKGVFFTYKIDLLAPILREKGAVYGIDDGGE